MAKTYLDNIVNYPNKVIRCIAENKFCLGLLIDKTINEVTENDAILAMNELIKDYQFIDSSTQNYVAYIWVDTEIKPSEKNTFNEVSLNVTIACHKDFMDLDGLKFDGIIGNRIDNLVRYIDKLLNKSDFMGVGALKLSSIKTLTPINGLTLRKITYVVPEFKILKLDE